MKTLQAFLVAGLRLDKTDGVAQIVFQPREYAAWGEVEDKWLYTKRNNLAAAKHLDWWKE